MGGVNWIIDVLKAIFLGHLIFHALMYYILLFKYIFQKDNGINSIDKIFDDLRIELKKLYFYDLDFKVDYLYAMDRFNDGGIFQSISTIFDELIVKKTYRI